MRSSCMEQPALARMCLIHTPFRIASSDFDNLSFEILTLKILNLISTGAIMIWDSRPHHTRSGAACLLMHFIASTQLPFLHSHVEHIAYAKTSAAPCSKNITISSLKTGRQFFEVSVSQSCSHSVRPLAHAQISKSKWAL